MGVDLSTQNNHLPSLSVLNDSLQVNKIKISTTEGTIRSFQGSDPCATICFCSFPITLREI